MTSNVARYPMAALRERLRDVEESARDLTQTCLSAAEALDASGAIPGEDLAARIEIFLQDVDELAGFLTAEPAAAKRTIPDEDLTASVFGDLLDRIENDRRRQRELQRMIARAAAVLRSAAALKHVDDPALDAPRAAASGLMAALPGMPADAVPAEVQRLLEGSHPLAALVQLACGGAELDDAAWAALQETVSAEFGRSLGAAVARGRIVTQPPVVENVDESQPL